MALDPKKLDRVLALMESIDQRVAALEARGSRADDQARDADGKFASGGGGGEASAPSAPAGKWGGGAAKGTAGEWEKKGGALRMGFKGPNGKTRYHEVREVGPGEVYTTTHGHTQKHASVEAAKKFVEETITENAKHNASVRGA